MKRILQLSVFVAGLMASWASIACVPAPQNPQKDATTADVIFVGIVTGQRLGPPATVMRDIILTIESTASLKGIAPIKLEISPDCGDHYPDLGDKVIVVGWGGNRVIRRSGGRYEQLLTAALADGR